MPKPTQAPRIDANCQTPSSVLSSRESLRAKSFLDRSSCGACSRSSSNNDSPDRAIRSKNPSSPTRCTGREQTSTAGPTQSFGWTPGAFATNCGSTTTVDPIPSSSRCRRAATYQSSKGIPPHSPTRLLHHPPTRLLHCSGGAGATANAAGSELQAHEDRGQRTGDRRRDCRSGTCVARTHQAGQRSNPTAPFGFVPRCGRTTCLVPGRRPRCLRLVRPSRAWCNGYLCESRRE